MYPIGEFWRGFSADVVNCSVRVFRRHRLTRTIALNFEVMTPFRRLIVEPPRPPPRRPCRVQYVLRVVYRERMQETIGPVGATPSAMPDTRGRGPKGGGGAPRAAAASEGGDQRATDLSALATAAKGLLQRTRVLSKRLNSLCAIHPQLMWELEEARRLRLEAGARARIEEEPLQFPDPYELGTLEVSCAEWHRWLCHVVGG